MKSYSDTNTILSTCKLITPHKEIPNGAVAWDGSGKIIFVGPAKDLDEITGQHFKADELIAAPGMIDIHVHGGFGVTFGLGDLESELQKYSEWVAQNGVTGFIITITGPDPDFIISAINGYVPLLEKDFPGAQPLGLHLEGPFLTPKNVVRLTSPGSGNHPLKKYESIWTPEKAGSNT